MSGAKRATIASRAVLEQRLERQRCRLLAAEGIPNAPSRASHADDRPRGSRAASPHGVLDFAQARLCG